jgi:hypothetical protein
MEDGKEEDAESAPVGVQASACGSTDTLKRELQQSAIPIAPGADPARNPGLANPFSNAYRQTESRQMPITTPEVDSATALSRAGLQMPALGYSIPNSNDTAKLETLDKIGLANSRAAHALRRSFQTPDRKETFNIQHSTFNSQQPMNARTRKPWALNVEC